MLKLTHMDAIVLWRYSVSQVFFFNPITLFVCDTICLCKQVKERKYEEEKDTDQHCYLHRCSEECVF